MSGHNKWSKVKNKKAVTDARKSKIFSKHSRLIALESKNAGGDKSAPGLRAAIEKAKRDSMPGDNIDRAVARGAGGEGGEMKEVIYETYGPGGVAIVVACLTDNRNRTGPEVKHLLSKYNCELSAQGSALWGFEQKGGEYVPTTPVSISEENGEKLGNLIDALEELDDVQDVYTNAE